MKKAFTLHYTYFGCWGHRVLSRIWREEVKQYSQVCGKKIAYVLELKGVVDISSNDTAYQECSGNMHPRHVSMLVHI